MKLITANKLNRFWHNGVLAKMVAKAKVLNTAEEIEANTSAENVAGALVAKELYNNLMQQPEWIKDSTGKITGYKTPGGADTVFPFSNITKAYEQSTYRDNATNGQAYQFAAYTIPKTGRYLINFHSVGYQRVGQIVIAGATHRVGNYSGILQLNAGNSIVASMIGGGATVTGYLCIYQL